MGLVPRLLRNILATFQRATIAATRLAGRVRIMRRISVGILIVAILSLHACSNSGTELEKEEYAVYSDLIDIFFIQKGGIGSNPDPKVLVISNEVLLESSRGPAWKGSEAFVYDDNLGSLKRVNLEDSLIDEFEAKRALGPKTIKDLFSFDVPVVLISKSEFDQIPGKWENFYKKFPDSQGYMMLSRVGFNSDRTKALVYVTNICGRLCGIGCYFLLHKEYGDWIIREEFDCVRS